MGEQTEEKDIKKREVKEKIYMLGQGGIEGGEVRLPHNLKFQRILGFLFNGKFKFVPHH